MWDFLQARAPEGAPVLRTYHDSCYSGLLAGVSCWHDGLVADVWRRRSGRHHWQKVWYSQVAIQQSQELGWKSGNVHRQALSVFLDANFADIMLLKAPFSAL